MQQPSIIVAVESIRVGTKVYRLDKSFPTLEAAERYHDLLERRLSGELGIATTATVSRSEFEPPEFDLPIVHDLVTKDIRSRRDHGDRKYKVPLQPFDGNDQLIEAYQEGLDLLIYLRSLIYEKYEGKG